MARPDPEAPIEGPYVELRAIAASLDVPYAGAPLLVIERDGITVEVSLHINSGRVTGLCLQTHRRGLPEVTFRSETDADRSGKERGMNVEVELGDPAFDAAVYVETVIPDSAVYELLAAPEARAAILELVVSCGAVVLSEEVVSASSSEREHFEPDRFRGLLDAFLVVAALPTVSFSPLDTKEPSGVAHVALAAVAAPFSLGLLAAGLAIYTPEGAAIVAIGASLGLVAWVATLPFLGRLVRGHARSYFYYKVLVGLGFLDLVSGGAAVSVILNGGLDNAPVVRDVGRIVSIRHHVEDRDKRTSARVRWSDGHEDDERFDGEGESLREGDAVVTLRRRGRFGYAWIQDSCRPYAGTAGKEP